MLLSPGETGAITIFPLTGEMQNTLNAEHDTLNKKADE